MTSLAFHQNDKLLIGELAQSLLGIFSQREDSEPLFFFRLCWPEAAAYGKVMTKRSASSSDLSC